MYFSLIKFRGETTHSALYTDYAIGGWNRIQAVCLPAECLYKNETAAPIRTIREPFAFVRRHFDMFSRCRPKWANSCSSDIVSSRLGRMYSNSVARATSSNERASRGTAQ